MSTRMVLLLGLVIEGGDVVVDDGLACDRSRRFMICEGELVQGNAGSR